MKKFRKILLFPVIVLLTSNLPFVSEILSVFFYATVAPPFCYITKDVQFYACGDVESIRENTDYKLYKQKFPERDNTLYRHNRIREWNIFLCGEFI